jgi:Putative prokaryotic signal transducing protein
MRPTTITIQPWDDCPTIRYVTINFILLGETVMVLRDPFAAYNAANNIEAHLVCNALREAGLDATVIEDVSAVGTWMFGLIPEVHKPQVWIERADVDRAKPVLDEFERQAAERRRVVADAPEIEVVCEECGERSLFPGNQYGSVQNCPRCSAFVDVGDDLPFDAWDVSGDEEA